MIYVIAVGFALYAYFHKRLEDRYRKELLFHINEIHLRLSTKQDRRGCRALQEYDNQKPQPYVSDPCSRKHL